MATSTMGIKRKPLSISEKLNIISKVDGTPNAPRTKIAEELGISVTTLHTVTYNRNKIHKQSVTEQLNRKKIKTAKYEKVEAILMEWFRQKWALNS
jgi:purine nucleoside phosphorylase